MNIEAINREINSYNKKIEERKVFISNINTLIDNANKSSQGLRLTSENLSKGLTIDGQSVDQGKLMELSSKLSNNVSKLSAAIAVANSEIRSYEAKINTLEARKRSLIEQENRKRAAELLKKPMGKNEDTNRS